MATHLICKCGICALDSYEVMALTFSFGLMNIGPKSGVDLKVTDFSLTHCVSMRKYQVRPIQMMIKTYTYIISM